MSCKREKKEHCLGKVGGRNQVIIYVSKKYYDSPEQLNWIKRASVQSFPNVGVTALFIKDKQKKSTASSTIPTMKQFRDHRFSDYHRRQLHCKRNKKKNMNNPYLRQERITDEEFYSMLKSNKYIDNVFMINNHFDLNLPLTYLTNMTTNHYKPPKIYFYMTHNDVQELYTHYLPYFCVTPTTDGITDYAIGYNIDLTPLNKVTPAIPMMNNVTSNGSGVGIIPQTAFSAVFCNTFIVPKFHRNWDDFEDTMMKDDDDDDDTSATEADDDDDDDNEDGDNDNDDNDDDDDDDDDDEDDDDDSDDDSDDDDKKLIIGNRNNNVFGEIISGLSVPNTQKWEDFKAKVLTDFIDTLQQK